MGQIKENKVRMIGPKGRTAMVSRKAADSKHLANLGYVRADQVFPMSDEVPASRRQLDQVVQEREKLAQERATFEREKAAHEAAKVADAGNNTNSGTDGDQA